MAVPALLLRGLAVIGALQLALIGAASSSDVAIGSSSIKEGAPVPLSSSSNAVSEGLGPWNLLRFNATRVNDYGDAGTWLVEVGPSLPGLTIVPQSKKLKKPLTSSLKCFDSKRIFDRTWRRYVTNSFRHNPYEVRGDRCGSGSSLMALA